MRAFKTIGFFITVISIFSCKPSEILLHGNLAGSVTDAESGMPVSDATVILNIANDTTITADDGSFLLKNLTPGQYEIQASKVTYALSKQIADVEPAETRQIDFSLNGIPTPDPSVKFLDFGLDSTSLTFSISNIGKGKFTYILSPSKEWITVSTISGEITNDQANIIVTVNRTGLSNAGYKESIKLRSFAGQNQLPDLMIPVFVNGAVDRDGNYYDVVRIGPMIWMSQNINVGTEITGNKNSTNNGIIEKYCYDNNPKFCNTYGGLYQWDEMMQYNRADDGLIGTTQGICPVGWHIPSGSEWDDLIIYSGETLSEKLKEAGYDHWSVPNLGATNDSGFTGLPGGYSDPESGAFWDLGIQGNWWSSTEFLAVPATEANALNLNYNRDISHYTTFKKTLGNSVRCVKNP